MATDLTQEIAPHLPVLAADGTEIGTVDHLDGDASIKLTRDDQGAHHWIPRDWVERVDAHVHLNRDAAQARQEWSTEGPA